LQRRLFWVSFAHKRELHPKTGAEAEPTAGKRAGGTKAVAIFDSPSSRSAFLGSVAIAPRTSGPMSLLRSIPREIVLLVATTFSVLIALGAGALIASQVPEHSPWLFMLSYAGPTSVVFGVFWLTSGRL
jgi:hypothetical protein